MVFVIGKDDKLEPHPVELDGWSNGQWIVTKGVKSGDRVLVEGFIKAHDPGMVVKPVPYVPAPPGAPGAQGGSAGSAPPAAAAGSAPASAASK
jgi:membrane fusion protein (multidrug efflux system)